MENLGAANRSANRNKYLSNELGRMDGRTEAMLNVAIRADVPLRNYSLTP